MGSNPYTVSLSPFVLNMTALVKTAGYDSQETIRVSVHSLAFPQCPVVMARCRLAIPAGYARLETREIPYHDHTFTGKPRNPHPRRRPQRPLRLTRRRDGRSRVPARPTPESGAGHGRAASGRPGAASSGLQAHMGSRRRTA